MNIEWRKGSRSDNGVGGECVEVAGVPAVALWGSSNAEAPGGRALDLPPHGLGRSSGVEPVEIDGEPAVGRPA